MSYMKLLAQMSHDVQSTKDSLSSLKTAMLRAKSKQLNYVVYQREIWTYNQIEGMIAILDKKITDDTLCRPEPTDSE